MLVLNVIKPSSSDCSSAPDLHDDSVKLFIEYRKLSKKSVSDTFLPSFLSDCLSTLYESKYSVLLVCLQDITE